MSPYDRPRNSSSHDAPEASGNSPHAHDAHGEEHWQREVDNVDVGLVGVVGVFGVVTFVLIVILMQAWFYSWKQDAAASRLVASDDPQTALGALRSEQQERLGSYRWIDRDAGVRAIPIDRAMQVVAQEMAAGPKKPDTPR